jgi:8-oxo-dGTP diphosphatase
MPKVVSSMKALIKHDNKYLFLHEELPGSKVWDLPGGKIEYGEEPMLALHREVKEETGLDIEAGPTLGVWWFYSPHQQHQVICHTFLCQIKGKSTIDLTYNPADEHFSDYRWLSIEEIINDQNLDLPESLMLILKRL